MQERDGCGLVARDHRCQTCHDRGEDENLAIKKRNENDGRGSLCEERAMEQWTWGDIGGMGTSSPVQEG